MRSLAMPILAAVFTATLAPPADAAVLWWKKVIGRSMTYEGCMKNARGNGLSNVQVKPDEVSGTSIDGKVYVAITCVGRQGERAVAIIAGVGDDSAWVKRVVEETAEQVRTSGVP
jgi:hypothetical protein